MLMPELLLYDDDLVRVGYDKQLNYIRDYASNRDTEQLKPFTVPRRLNKQIWLTFHITDRLTSVRYTGQVIKGKLVKNLNISVQVNPFILPAPMIDYALHYEGRLSEDGPIKAEAWQKNRE